MTRGISQGCPLSALLFLFVAEILAIKIKKNNQNINGIAINNIEIKNIQHADDFTVVLKDELSMKNALDTINTFCRNDGSKIIIDKTECISIGDLKSKFEKIFEIKVTKQAIRCLRIYIGHDKEECYNQNWIRMYHELKILSM